MLVLTPALGGPSGGWGSMTSVAPAERAAELAAEVAHELRSPLGGVEAMAALLAETALSADQRRLVDGLLAAAAHLRAVADDILEAGAAGERPVFAETPLDLAGFLAPLATAAAARAQAKGLSFSARIDERITRPLLTDRRRLRQMLENLIDNAVKVTREGGIVIDVSLIDRRGGFDGLRFSVTDTGPGLSEAEAQRLFRPYGRLDNGVKGTGLGLALVRRLARAMGGDAGCDAGRDRGGAGATFWFTLRLKQAEAEAPAAVDAPRGAAGHGGCILVVDDNQANRLIMGAVLEHFGHAMAEAASAEQALAMLPGGRFAAILLDHTLPGISGLEALKLIRAMPEPLASLPIVPVTGRVSPADRAAFAAAGADGFVEKPVTARAVREALDAALEAAARRRA